MWLGHYHYTIEPFLSRHDHLRVTITFGGAILCQKDAEQSSTSISFIRRLTAERVLLFWPTPPEANKNLGPPNIEFSCPAASSQVVLSQRFQGEGDVDPLSVYRALRMINPSPYMFLLRMGDESLVGSSPEVMVRAKDGEAVVRPIAGTRPRGETTEQDEQRCCELLADPKEVAEHVMLVDLARNDLGRIAAAGAVSVDQFKTVEKYSHVMHIVSNVRAKIAEGYDAFDVLRATFPAGTLTGAPKIRAMEIIEDLEPEHRGPYGGCVGYFSFTGSMDMGITIRSVAMKGNRAYFQAGAGIVADSVAEKEYLETMSKAEAMRRAFAMPQELEGRQK